MRIGSVAMAAIALALAACGREPAEGASGGSAATPASPGDRGASNAVAAVLHSEGAPLARVAFLIEARPVAGKAFALKLLLTPVEAVPSVQVGVESTSLVAAPAAGVVTFDELRGAVAHDLTVTAQNEGLADLTVRLKSEGAAAETVYVIPVLVAAE